MRAGPAFWPPAPFAPFQQTAVSAEAAGVQNDWLQFVNKILASVALGAQYRELRASLDTLATEAGKPNWDGQGASEINRESVEFARRIAQLLPLTKPAPEISVDPDGEVSFDWQRDRTHTLSFSIDPAGTLRYASILGTSENYGVEPWRDGLPDSVFLLIQKVARAD
jgi:hypothetical protein